MKYTNNNGIFTFFLEGKLLSDNADRVYKELEEVLEEKDIKEIVLDLTKLEYISSSGLRLVLKLQQRHKNVSVINASLEVYEVFDMTGFADIIPVRKALREIDISSAKVIGDGFSSVVYRLNGDTIVKVFNERCELADIERELRLAKQAFVLGIPTAISFDIVKVGKQYGVCFEMLDCESLQAIFKNQLGRYDEYLRKYALLLKTINTTSCADPSLPRAKEIYAKGIEPLESCLEPTYYRKAKRLIDSIEERDTFVHGDCHFKNIMVQKDELYLIDMDTLSVGHPIFELSSLHFAYVCFSEDDPGNCDRFFGISDAKVFQIYNDLMELYFGKDDAAIKDKIAILSYLHMLAFNRDYEPDNTKRFEGVKKRLYALLNAYNDLNIGI